MMLRDVHCRARRARRRGCRARRSTPRASPPRGRSCLDRRHRRVALLVVGRVHDDLVEDLVQAPAPAAEGLERSHGREMRARARGARAGALLCARTTAAMVLFTILPRSASRTHIGCVTCSIVPTARARATAARGARAGSARDAFRGAARRATRRARPRGALRAQQDPPAELRLLQQRQRSRRITWRTTGPSAVARRRGARARGVSAAARAAAPRDPRTHRIGRDVRCLRVEHVLHHREPASRCRARRPEKLARGGGY